MGAKNILLGWVHMKKLNDEYKRLMQEAKYYLQEAEDKNEKLQKIFDEIKVNVLAKSVLDSCLNAIEATIRACIIAAGYSFGKEIKSERFGNIIKTAHKTLYSLFFSKFGKLIDTTIEYKGIKFSRIPTTILDYRNVLYPGASSLPNEIRKEISEFSVSATNIWVSYIEKELLLKILHKKRKAN